MRKIMIMAGEASGDLHGANLALELKKQDPSIGLYGVGSRRMRDAGVTMLADAAQISVVGATEVITHLRPLCRVFNGLVRFLRDERPDMLILIDFPDFNIRLGKRAKALGIPVVYYISPQVWAWRKGRVKTIAGLVRAMIVAFPFEVPIYQHAGVDVRFAGHPLADVVHSAYTRDEANAALGLDPKKRTVALLPGSRTKELDSLLPVMLEAAGMLRQRFVDLQFVLPLAPTISRESIEARLRQSRVPVTVAESGVYDVLRAADAALVASGTATLETGLMAVPMAIVYRVSALTAFIGRLFVKVDHIGLINIVAGERVVPELIQQDATPVKMAGEIANLLSDPAQYEQVRGRLLAVRAKLGEPGANRRIASIVRELLDKS